ncbi:hypothetical protein DVH05_025905 [Phytophthora capsici]|nr:hypothetical protein DVH05_025905 [Phytophthora capsici]
MGRRAEKYCLRVDMLNLQQEAPIVLDIYYSKQKKALLVVQPFVPSGSVKDRIYQVDNPSKSYDAKYRLENAHPLPFKEVAKFSRQILEALAALRSKGLVCDHLRSTNVLIDKGNARLAEIFTPLLAIDRYKDNRALTVSLDIDLLLFGHVLYEMATGMELLSPQPEEGVLEMLTPEIAEVLQAIFYYPESLEPPDTVSSSSKAEVESTVFDDVESVGRTVGSRNKKQGETKEHPSREHPNIDRAALKDSYRQMHHVEVNAKHL